MLTEQGKWQHGCSPVFELANETQQLGRRESGVVGPIGSLDPNVAKAEGAVDPMQYHPAKGGKGKQHGCFSSFLDITRSEFHKIVQISHGEKLLLVFRAFCHVVYATTGLTF
ncbi:MAG: hypothetical protein JRE24_08075 [Deltaproteobacteria bacterium]|nr:hypothetical protein [Deltaproteobacteria bacterium]